MAPAGFGVVIVTGSIYAMSLNFLLFLSILFQLPYFLPD